MTWIRYWIASILIGSLAAVMAIACTQQRADATSLPSPSAGGSHPAVAETPGGDTTVTLARTRAGHDDGGTPMSLSGDRRDGGMPESHRQYDGGRRLQYDGGAQQAYRQYDGGAQQAYRQYDGGMNRPR